MRILIPGVLFSALQACLASEDVTAPWSRNAFDVEIGKLWQAGENTNIDYEIVQARFSWRSPFVLKFDMEGGSTFVVRNQASLIANWIEEGPEDYYFAIAGSPSIEWWNPDNTRSIYFAIGGGFGVINSTGALGGQGQDFTLNWFMKAGYSQRIGENVSIFGGPFFQHMSNGGATDPNPGIDALGFSIGASFSF